MIQFHYIGAEGVLLEKAKRKLSGLQKQEVVFMEKDTAIGTQRLASLFDAGTFAEVGAYIKREDGKASGATCGYGAVNGKGWRGLRLRRRERTTCFCVRAGQRPGKGRV